MAVRNIVKEGNELLRKRSRNVEFFDQKLWTLLDDMKETLAVANGVGLAAPQVGILRKVFIAEVNGKIIEFVNPVLSDFDGSMIDNEGCLSVVEVRGSVVRPQKLKVSAVDRNGKAFSLELEDYSARIICHEYDHLVGVLFIDKMSEPIDEEDLI